MSGVLGIGGAVYLAIAIVVIAYLWVRLDRANARSSMTHRNTQAGDGLAPGELDDF